MLRSHDCKPRLPLHHPRGHVEHAGGLQGPRPGPRAEMSHLLVFSHARGNVFVTLRFYSSMSVYQLVSFQSKMLEVRIRMCPSMHLMASATSGSSTGCPSGPQCACSITCLQRHVNIWGFTLEFRFYHHYVNFSAAYHWNRCISHLRLVLMMMMHAGAEDCVSIRACAGGALAAAQCKARRFRAQRLPGCCLGRRFGTICCRSVQIQV